MDIEEIKALINSEEPLEPDEVREMIDWLIVEVERLKGEVLRVMDERIPYTVSISEAYDPDGRSYKEEAERYKEEAKRLKALAYTPKGFEWKDCLKQCEAELKEARSEIERLNMLKTGARVIEIEEATQIVAQWCADLGETRFRNILSGDDVAEAIRAEFGIEGSE